MTLVKDKIRPPEKGGPRPEWAKRIESARKRLNLTQAAFANTLRVTQAAVSRWESGSREPDTRMYIEIAGLVGPRLGESERLYFFNRAGIDPVEIKYMDGTTIPTAWQPITSITLVPGRGASKVDDPYALKKNLDAVGIALLKDPAAAGSQEQIDEAVVERTIIADAHDCPHPDRTVCIRVVGDSMRPILDDSYIVAVDTKDNIPQELVGKMVAARDPEGGVTIKWLRKGSGELMLVAQHTSQRYSPVLLNREPGWRILGRVIWWIGKPK